MASALECGPPRSGLPSPSPAEVDVQNTRPSGRVRQGVALCHSRCYTQQVPTTQPRYTVTDTGEVRKMLDLAQRLWPEVDDRKQLLLRLVTVGRDTIAPEVDDRERERRRERQLAALRRARELIDPDELLADAAWR